MCIYDSHLVIYYLKKMARISNMSCNGLGYLIRRAAQIYPVKKIYPKATGGRPDKVGLARPGQRVARSSQLLLPARKNVRGRLSATKEGWVE